MTATFVCEKCRGEFEYAWSDEEAQAEASVLFPGLRQEDRAMVCDDCLKEIMGSQ